MHLIRELKETDLSLKIALGFTLLWNMLVYGGARMIAVGFHHYDMTLPIDRKIPFWTWTVVIYLGCYAFWGINYCLGIMQAKAEAWRFLCSEFLAKAICLLFFLLLPTTNVRPELDPVSIFDKAMAFVYHMDAADNLFPSIHCLVSWFCFIAVRKQKEIPKFYKVLSLIFALMVCVSTLTTKQHVIADVFSGIFIAECCYQLVKHTDISEIYRKCFRGRKE